MSPVLPTFHESWYRVADLKLRIRSSVHIVRQRYRGQRRYVVLDQANNASFSLSQPGYQLLGLLDGSRTLREAWEICCKVLGDEAPTQGEALDLLGQLASNNLLESELPPDAAGMFERYKKRKKRELQGALMNVLFPRIPIFDPDAILEKAIFLVGWIFSWPGLVVWLAVVLAGVYTLLNRGPGLGAALAGASHILRPDNWLLLYGAFVLDKLVHESGHAIACKKFGHQNGTSGEVHVIGLMLLVFTPVPYVDASSAWLLKSRWQRAIVGAAGMWVEFALAAAAAMVWALSSPTSTLHDFAYNLMFIASVTTVIFNANPFLRYDGYYILADLLEIPNLFGRSIQYAAYLIKRYAFGLEHVINPADTPGQKIWLVIYLVLAGIVRVLVSSLIVLFLVRELHNHPEIMLLLAVMATAGIAVWLLVPLGRGIWYLVDSPELLHHRTRAMSISLVTTALLVGAVGLIPLPNHCRVEGVTRAKIQRRIYVQTSGFLQSFLPSGKLTHGGPNGTVLLRLANPSLQSKLASLASRWDAAKVRWRQALASSPAKAKIYRHEIQAIAKRLTRLRRKASDLTLSAPVSGTWIAPGLHLHIGAYLHRGQQVGTIADLHTMLVFGAADQNRAGRIIRAALHNAAIRVYGRPSPAIPAVIRREYPAGANTLPSAALSYLGGGPFAPDPQQHQPLATASPFFLLEVQPRKPVAWLPGQRVQMRLALPHESLAMQVLEMLRRALEPHNGA